MTRKLGAQPHANGWSFLVWAPDAKAVDLVIFSGPDAEARRLSMHRGDRGYFEVITDALTSNGLYKYAVQGPTAERSGLFPDPASRSQPFGVHGPSRCVALPRAPSTGPMRKLRDLVIYELHVGTFTRQGIRRSAMA